MTGWKSVVKRWWKVALIVSILGAFFYIKYDNQFAHARSFGDGWRRIPLWQPFEVVDFGYPNNVQLHDWRGNLYPIDDSVHVIGTYTNDEVIALQVLCDITHMGIGNNVLYGIRNVVGRPGYWGHRYFLFSTNCLEVLYFKERENYLSACRKHGVDGAQLSDFNACWTNFWGEHGQANVLQIIIDDFKEGFSMKETAILCLLLYWLLVSFRKVFGKADEGCDFHR